MKLFAIVLLSALTFSSLASAQERPNPAALFCGGLPHGTTDVNANTCTLTVNGTSYTVNEWDLYNFFHPNAPENPAMKK